MVQGRLDWVPERWARGIRRVVLPGMAAVGLFVSAPDELSAQSVWRWGRKKPPQSQSAAQKAAPHNGFASTIHKLQADAKQQAFDGDIEGAIANAQRARKIAEASSALVAEDPECSVEAAERLVQKLMAVKSVTSTPTGAPAASPKPTIARRQSAPAPAVATGKPGWQAPPIAVVETSAAPALRPRIGSSQRPLTIFTPHPFAAVVEPPPVVAGGWVMVEVDDTILADDTPLVSIEEVTASPVVFEAAALQTSNVSEDFASRSSESLESSSYSIVERQDSSGDPFADSSEPAPQPTAGGDAAPGWQPAGSDVAPAVGIDVELNQRHRMWDSFLTYCSYIGYGILGVNLPFKTSPCLLNPYVSGPWLGSIAARPRIDAGDLVNDSHDDQFQLLQQVEPVNEASPDLDSRESQLDANQRNSDSSPLRVAQTSAIERVDETVVTANGTASRQWKAVTPESEASHDAVEYVTPTTHHASQPEATVAAFSLASTEEEGLEAVESTPLMWFRDVEPLVVSKSESPQPSRLRALTGLGLIVLGAGMWMMGVASRTRRG